MSTTTRYRLVAPDRSVVVPELDEHQQRVVDHEGGPLLVLAGPGTGKTTTLVEAIVDRIEHRGASPDSVLALTFSRKAAEQLRDRVTARLGLTVAAPVAWTFHAFAFALVKRYTPHDLYAAPLRLMTAPEADVRIRDLLELHSDDLAWPEGLGVAARTRGFAAEVAAVIARAREKGADHEQLIELGIQRRIPEFTAAGIFLRHYLDDLDDHSATDYPDLMRRAVLEARTHRDELRKRYSHIFVDEYQDTDPGQVALLQALAGDGRELTVVGDPHQSIYGFRGADVRGILDFPTMFPQRDGSPAPTAVLSTTRRFGPELLAASQRIAARLPLSGGIRGEDLRRFAGPVAADDTSVGRVEVRTYDTDRAEVEHIADLLRRAHLEEGVAWSNMAVLVRSGRATLPVLRRTLSSAGVPVDVAADEIPLSDEPGVKPLLAALDVVVGRPGVPSAEAAEGLLLSPLCRLDATGLRSLGRDLRHRELATAASAETTPRGSAELVAAALADPALLDGLTSDAAVRARALTTLLDAAQQELAEGGSVEEVLWGLWSGSDWGTRLRGTVERGGGSARRAHRDLDAICALFDQAARTEEQRGFTSVQAFLDALSAQQIPADTMAEKGVRGEAVRLLTAHRSKGLEWPLVVVAHVQEGGWPDLRRRASLLGGDRIGAAGYGRLEVHDDISARALLAEERRLFYVACTRARDRLVVTAVASTADEGDAPSRFLEELDPEPEHVPRRPERPLTLSGIVSELRRTLVEEGSSTALREAAARRLVALSRATAHGRPLARAADPASWWGAHPRSASTQPVRPVDLPLRLSASQVTSLAECPAKWFLEHEAGGSSYSGQAAGIGTLVHKVAEHITSDALADADIDEVMTHIDAVWDQLPFRTPWSRHKEREVIKAALDRFLRAHRSAARELVGTEQAFDLEVELPDGAVVRLRGSADRVELDADGRVVVVDLKTSKSTPTVAQVSDHPQLGIYQLVAARGGLDAALPDDHGPGEPGGAELWQLRHAQGDLPKVQAQPVPGPDADGWLPAERQIADAVRRIRSEDFPATPSDKVCRYCSFHSICPAKSGSGVIS